MGFIFLVILAVSLFVGACSLFLMWWLSGPTMADKTFKREVDESGYMEGVKR